MIQQASLQVPLSPLPADPPPPPPAPPIPAAPLPDIPAPVYDAANQAMTDGQIPGVPAEVPHLLTPDNLPPGTTVDPTQLPQQGRNLTYLKELWHAIQTQDVSLNDAILGLAQRPLNPNAAPPAGLAPGPQPAAPAPAPLPPPAPAPVPLPPPAP